MDNSVIFYFGITLETERIEQVISKIRIIPEIFLHYFLRANSLH